MLYYLVFVSLTVAAICFSAPFIWLAWNRRASPSASEVHATLSAEAAEQRSHDRSGGK